MAVQRRHAIGTFVLERPATLSKATGNDSTERGKGRWDCILKAIQLWNSVGHNEGKKEDRFSAEIVSFLLIRFTALSLFLSLPRFGMNQINASPVCSRSVQSQHVCLARGVLMIRFPGRKSVRLHSVAELFRSI